MKNERGITLISLMIYVILMTFVVAGVSAVTSSFYSNMNSFDKTSESAVTFSKFNMHFLNDIKSANVKIETGSSSSVNGSSITLSMTNDKGRTEAVNYSMKNGGIYRDEVKICDKVKELKFTTDSSSKKVVTVYIRFNNYEKTTSYRLEPKEIKDSTPII